MVTTALYLVLLPLWWESVDGLAAILAASANLIYRLFDPRVSILSDGKNVSVFVTATQESGFGGQVHSSAFRLSTITYGLPMLIALVLSTRAESLIAKVRALSVGLLTMLVLTIPVVMTWAAMTGLQLQDRIALATHTPSSDGSGFLYYAFHGYAFSQPALAVALWLALMMLGLFKNRKKESEPAARASIARNAPCPCGSGRKFKRCCGLG